MGSWVGVGCLPKKPPNEREVFRYARNHRKKKGVEGI